MKKAHSLLAALVLTLVAGATSAFAQNPSVKAHVPFDFTVSSSTFSAGDYTFSELSETLWTVRNNNSSQAVAVIANRFGTNRDKRQAELVFTQIGSNYFLSEVHRLGDTTELPVSKAARTMEREIARNGSKPEAVYILASAR
jgi:hypothetical protein